MSPRRDKQKREQSIQAAEIWRAAQNDSLKLVVGKDGKLAPKLDAERAEPEDDPEPGA